MPRGIGEITASAAGVALIALALAANQVWLDRHFLPSFLLARVSYVRIETSIRLVLAAAGLSLVVLARSVASRLTARAVRRTLQIVAAVALALAASELALRRVHLRPSEWRAVEEEPRRRPDARLGWTFVPARTAHSTSGGRTIEYVFDAAGYRVPRADRPIDSTRPSILFAGESVMFGDGLMYDESVPAQVEERLGVQSVNMSVYGYSTDQMYLKLEAELPRFRRPIAVVSLFMTALFGRNLDDDRPHLGAGLAWEPAQTHARLVSLAGMLVAFRRDSTVEHGIAVTRDTFRAMARLAESRGATLLIVVPQLGPEDESERRLRSRILDEGQLPYVMVEIDPAWHIAWDRHPDARAAQLMAGAIAAQLRATSSSWHLCCSSR
jgi:hypothetical protein